eukprot:TRINITY_DN9505_c0_g1_i1.p1 TRINITY_DN9505_c0_g1~~TRINITY_DN9505_c0_g1_i1.p1  ORF type:complete len:821 (+),score=163.26 TRINITY_DN9505_c0_g1_i1:238-2463(+)
MGGGTFAPAMHAQAPTPPSFDGRVPAGQALPSQQPAPVLPSQQPAPVLPSQQPAPVLPSQQPAQVLPSQQPAQGQQLPPAAMPGAGGSQLQQRGVDSAPNLPAPTHVSKPLPPTASQQPPPAQDSKPPPSLPLPPTVSQQPVSSGLQPPPSESIYGGSMCQSMLSDPFASHAIDQSRHSGADPYTSYAGSSASAQQRLPPTATPTANPYPQIPVNVSVCTSQSPTSPGSIPNAATASALQRWLPRPEDDSETRTRAQAPVLPTGKASASEEYLDQVLAERGYQIVRDEGSKRPGMPRGALGRGAFGVVYKALRKSDNKLLALKQAERASATEVYLEKEIDILRLLDHPSIVRFFEAFPHKPSDWMFITMELVDGGDLIASLTLEPQVYDEALVRPMLFHIASAIAHAHERGVVHRDLKPENVLLRRSDRFPKVADFGLARMMQASEMAATIAGTPTYMAPEIQDPRVPYDFSADVYSLGCILSDMTDPKYCCNWYVQTAPSADHERMRKKWPAGTVASQFSSDLLQIQKSMCSQVPGSRPTCYAMVFDLLTLADKSPLPHHLWQIETQLPQQPPPRKALTAKDAIEIAGRGGYGKGSQVLVLVDNAWHRGKVKHVSTGLCPGAVQVHFHQSGQEQAVLVCPWQFADMLRPDTSAATVSKVGSPDFPTMVFGEEKAPLANSPQHLPPMQERSPATATASSKDKKAASSSPGQKQIQEVEAVPKNMGACNAIGNTAKKTCKQQ